jgi:hypothetical protein
VQILRLETALATTLVHRNGRKLLLTEAAMAFLPNVRTMLPASGRNGCAGCPRRRIRRTGRTDLSGRLPPRRPLAWPTSSCARTQVTSSNSESTSRQRCVPKPFTIVGSRLSVPGQSRTAILLSVVERLPAETSTALRAGAAALEV